MTTETQPLPTDAELDTLLPMVQLNGEKPAQMVWLTRKDARAFSRAVLAKWGTPAPVGEEPVAWAATSEDGDVEALGMNQSRRFDTPLYTHPPPPDGMAGWQPIETAPKDGREILGYTEEVGALVMYWDTMSQEQDHWSDGMSISYWTPTHWMPLPAPPSSAQKEPT